MLPEQLLKQRLLSESRHGASGMNILCLRSPRSHDVAMRAPEDLASRVEIWLLSGLTVEGRLGVGDWLQDLGRGHWEETVEERHAWWFWSFDGWRFGLGLGF